MLNKYLSNTKLFGRAAASQRFIAGIVFLAVLAVLFFFYAIAAGWVDSEQLFGRCGFKENYGLPCPTCGMTAAVIAFMHGKIFLSLYTQPLGCIFCLFLLVVAFFSLLSVCFGVKCTFLGPLRLWQPGYIILGLLILIAIGWAVTLIRAFVQT